MWMYFIIAAMWLGEAIMCIIGYDINYRPLAILDSIVISILYVIIGIQYRDRRSKESSDE